MLPIHTVLHPTDFSYRSSNALQMACAVAHDYGARLVIVHVSTRPIVGFGEGVIPPDPDELMQTARLALDRLELPQSDIRVERRAEEGDPPREILRVAEEVNADLIVMGTHGRTGLRRLLMGSVAEEVLRKSTCPVLTVTTPVHAEPEKESLRTEPGETAEPGLSSMRPVLVM